jgi:hypothetical protein
MDGLRAEVRTTLRGIAALVAATLVGVGACASHDGSVEQADAADTTYRTRRGYVIDSALSVEEEIARFRAQLDSTSALAGGKASREALIAAFAKGITTRDTIALRRLLVSREEFAFLIYPASPYTRPPYRQPPDIVWMQLRAGDSGLRRLLERRGGNSLTIASHRCEESHESSSYTLWRNCMVGVVNAPGDTVTERLFGVIVEHRGQFKFASFANQY